MEEEPSEGPSHNNPAEAAEYVRSVNSLLQSFVTDIHGFDRYKHLDAWETARFIQASLQIGQRIFHQNGHRSYTRHNTRQSL